MDKQIVTYLYNRILPSNKKEQTTYTQKSIGESLKYGTYQKEPRTKRVLWLLKYVYKIFLMILLLKVQSNSSQQSALTIRRARERIFCRICFYRRNISVIARCSLVLPKFLRTIYTTALFFYSSLLEQPTFLVCLGLGSLKPCYFPSDDSHFVADAAKCPLVC